MSWVIYTLWLCPLPYCDAVSWRNEIKTIKPIVNEEFVASSGDIIIDYTDLYCLFTRRGFVIGEMPNKHYSSKVKSPLFI